MQLQPSLQPELPNVLLSPHPPLLPPHKQRIRIIQIIQLHPLLPPSQLLHPQLVAAKSLMFKSS